MKHLYHQKNILTKNGWKSIDVINKSDIIFTLNTSNNQIELNNIDDISSYYFNGVLPHIKSRNIDEFIFTNCGYPIYNRNRKFKKFITYNDLICNDQNLSDYYIPKTAEWCYEYNDTITIEPVDRSALPNNLKKNLVETYTKPLILKLDCFMKFIGIYLSEGNIRKKGYGIQITQVKKETSKLIEEMLIELGLPFSIENSKSGKTTYYIFDARLHTYLKPLGDCYNKYIPFEIKNKSKELLIILYDWFVLGDGRKRGSVEKYQSTDVFSTSKQLILDLNEIQFKIGYNGSFHEEKRDYDRYISNRLIKGVNCKPLYFTYKSLTKGIYLSKKHIQISEKPYNGIVHNIKVKNNTFYTMVNGKTHWCYCR